MKTVVLVVVGTRPELIKMAPVIREILQDSALDLVFVHSGQHYDYALSATFIEELGLPSPDANLGVGSGTHSQQTSKTVLGCERVFQQFQPAVVLVEGDTNTALGAAIASNKLRIPVGHVEAGLRSFDRTMPEEINRRIIDVCADLHFAPSERAAVNLLHEGILPQTIFVTGNTIVDACHQHLDLARRKSTILHDLGLTARTYSLVTVHRAENTVEANLRQIVDILQTLNDCTLVFPVHPRSKKMLEEMQLLDVLEGETNVILTPPLGYFNFLNLLSQTKYVLTDSGGVQEEADALNIPCMTLRSNTERPETVDAGVNTIVGLDKNRIKRTIRQINRTHHDDKGWRKDTHPYGDGKAGQHIVRAVKHALIHGFNVPSPIFLRRGSASHRLVKVTKAFCDKPIQELSQLKRGSIVVLYDRYGHPQYPYPTRIPEEGDTLLFLGE
jgi:UDP-N-acetylglucosamine 2-epimerase (non-hydrolysing)